MKKTYLLITLALLLAILCLIWFFHPSQALKRKSETILKNFTAAENSKIVTKSLFSQKLYATNITVALEDGVTYFQQIPYLQTKRTISKEKMVQYSQSVNQYAEILEHTAENFTVNKLAKNHYSVEFTNSMRIKLKKSAVNTTVSSKIRFIFIKGNNAKEGYQLAKIIFF